MAIRPDSNDPRDIADFVASQLDALESRFVEHLDSRFGEMKAMYLAGFPNDDPGVHRTYHETLIEESRARAAFYRNLLEKSLLGMAWTGVALVGTALWSYLKSQLGSGT